MMHAGASEPALDREIVAAAATGFAAPDATFRPRSGCRVTAATGLLEQACLWPPCFQWTFWHAAEQYFTPLHLAHRCNPGASHPSLAHLGTSSVPALPLPPSPLPVPLPAIFSGMFCIVHAMHVHVWTHVCGQMNW
jgi:hypothetical protein